MRRTRAFRSLAPVAVLALVSTLAAACNDGGDNGAADSSSDYVHESGTTVGGEDSSVPALTSDQIAEAVLQDDNLGDGWTSSPATDDKNDSPGCLADVHTLTAGLTKKARGGTEFAYGDSQLPYIESTVTAYADEIGIAAVFDQVQVALDACTSISAPDGDGNQWDLTLHSDDDTTYDVDDQIHTVASGTFTQAGGGSPTQIYIEWTSVRVGPNVGSITSIDTKARTDEHATWTQIAVDRLLAVCNGEEPTATTAPAPA